MVFAKPSRWALIKNCAEYCSSLAVEPLSKISVDRHFLKFWEAFLRLGRMHDFKTHEVKISFQSCGDRPVYLVLRDTGYADNMLQEHSLCLLAG